MEKVENVPIIGFEKLDVGIKIEKLQKTMLLRTARILRKVLEIET